MNARGLREARDAAGRTQRIAHQGAAPGTQLDQAERRWAAELLPGDRAPQADQLAEYLADLRSGDEIACRADAVAPLPAAVLGIGQANLHVLVDAQRPVAADALAQAHQQRVVFGSGLTGRHRPRP